MDIKFTINLLIVAALFGSSFLFLKLATPSVHYLLIAQMRIIIACAFLFIVSKIRNTPLSFTTHWRHYFIVGLFAYTIPFFLFSYAATRLNASVLSIINATVPLWGFALIRLYYKTPVLKSQYIGLLLGFSGVILLTGLSTQTQSTTHLNGLIAGLIATLSYAIAYIFIDKNSTVSGFQNAAGGLLASTLWLIPFIPFTLPDALPPLNALLSILSLGVVCTGIAFILYFNLLKKSGMVSLSAAFLVPLFGVMWGVLLLNEALYWYTFVGGLLILIGTIMVTKMSLRTLFIRK